MRTRDRATLIAGLALGLFLLGLVKSLSPVASTQRPVLEQFDPAEDREPQLRGSRERVASQGTYTVSAVIPHGVGGTAHVAVRDLVTGTEWRGPPPLSFLARPGPRVLVTVTHHACHPWTQQWELTPGATDLCAELLAAHVLHARVENELGERIPGALVTARLPGARELAQQRSDDAGAVELRVRGGEYLVVGVRHSDYVPFSQTIRVAQWPATRTLVVRRGAPLRVVLDMSMWGSTGGWLDADMRGTEGGAALRRSIADIIADGDETPVLGYLDPGTYSVRIVHRGVVLARASDLPIPGPPLRVLALPSVFLVEVLDPEGTPVRKARVTASSGADRVQGYTDKLGLVRLAISDWATLLIEHREYASATERVNPADHERHRVYLRRDERRSRVAVTGASRLTGAPFSGWFKSVSSGRVIPVRGAVNESSLMLPYGDLEFRLDRGKNKYGGYLTVSAPTLALRLGPSCEVSRLTVVREVSPNEGRFWVRSSHEDGERWLDGRIAPHAESALVEVSGGRHTVYGVRDGGWSVLGEVQTPPDAVLRIRGGADEDPGVARIGIRGAGPGEPLAYWAREIPFARVQADDLGRAQLEFALESPQYFNVSSAGHTQTALILPGASHAIDVAPARSATLRIRCTGVRELAAIQWDGATLRSEALSEDDGVWSGHHVSPPCLLAVTLDTGELVIELVGESGLLRTDYRTSTFLNEDGTPYTGAVGLFWPPDAPPGQQHDVWSNLVYQGICESRGCCIRPGITLGARTSLAGNSRIPLRGTAEASGVVRLHR